MKRTASARWEGSLKEGRGTMSSGSGAIAKLPYSFRTRFEDQPGTNPEELVGAAHAGCFSMAFSAELGNAGFTPSSVATTATVTFEPVDGKPTVSSIHLDMTAKVPGIDAVKFQQIAEAAKQGCPISRLLKTNITLSAKLES
jgi:osmotically inducible protein OsmC